MIEKQENPLDALRLKPEEVPVHKWSQKTTWQELIDAQLNKCLRELMPLLKEALSGKAHEELTDAEWCLMKERIKKARALVAAWEAAQKQVKP